MASLTMHGNTGGHVTLLCLRRVVCAVGGRELVPAVGLGGDEGDGALAAHDVQLGLALVLMLVLLMLLFQLLPPPPALVGGVAAAAAGTAAVL